MRRTAIMMLYNKQYKSEYEDQRNTLVTCRTLAAYGSQEEQRYTSISCRGIQEVDR